MTLAALELNCTVLKAAQLDFGLFLGNGKLKLPNVQVIDVGIPL
jgi:hypothetical protein